MASCQDVVLSVKQAPQEVERITNLYGWREGGGWRRPRGGLIEATRAACFVAWNGQLSN